MFTYSFLAKESAILLYAGGLGLELGLVYDLFRIFRRVWKCGFFMNTCMDLLFWGFTAFRTFYMMHSYSDGTLRWFAIFGVMVILLVYMRWFSRYIVAAGVFGLTKVRKFISNIKNFLTKVLKAAIMKVTIKLRKDKHNGKKSRISDEITQ